MNITVREIDEVRAAVIDSPDLLICSEQDALDLIVEAGYMEAQVIILPARNLCSDFFDLSTGVAGSILQKFSNYRVKLAIVGTFDRYESKSLAAFMRESNRGNSIFFVPDIDTAVEYLNQRR